MSGGFIKLHRSMMGWEWASDHNTFRLFIFMLFMANHKDKSWQGIRVNRGQFVSGLHSLADKTGLTIQQIRTSIKRLKSTGELTSKSTNKFTIYTIENYSKYQNKNTEVTNDSTSQLTNEQQATNNKQECKEVKKKEKEIIELLFNRFWEAGMRKVNKSKARTSFTNIINKQKDKESFVNQLIDDIQKRKCSEQLGFSEMHPTTYLNNQRWEDEITIPNQPINQPDQGMMI